MANSDMRGKWSRPKNRVEIRGDHVAVFLRRENGPDLEMLVELCDLPRIQSLPGRISAYKGHKVRTFYAHATLPDHTGKHRSIHIHRFLCDAPEGMVVDHPNHNGLD